MHVISQNFSWIVTVGACGQLDRASDFRSKGLGFDFCTWSSVKVLGKLFISYCPGPPNCNGYLVHRSKVGLIVVVCHRCPTLGEVNDLLIILYIYIYIYIYIQRITMCPHGYHHSGSMATPALGTRDVYIYICSDLISSTIALKLVPITVHGITRLSHIFTARSSRCVPALWIHSSRSSS